MSFLLPIGVLLLLLIIAARESESGHWIWRVLILRVNIGHGPPSSPLSTPSPQTHPSAIPFATSPSFFLIFFSPPLPEEKISDLVWLLTIPLFILFIPPNALLRNMCCYFVVYIHDPHKNILKKRGGVPLS
ncbi:MAG: hypothetical protein J3R72DRAFT_159891 [Linnemannia gamsii]|nr:MAG: hypothetical protein J3R72DRAFT_159891 [Linnemannia gamsii]